MINGKAKEEDKPKPKSNQCSLFCRGILLLDQTHTFLHKTGRRKRKKPVNIYYVLIPVDANSNKTFSLTRLCNVGYMLWKSIEYSLCVG